MCDRAWESMDEKDFETVLESSVAEIPPEDIVAEVTPWKKAMHRVLIGITLSVVTLNFWCLNYILPAIGTVLSLLGYRTLRRENKWFRVSFIITVIQAACFFPTLFLNTTIIQSAISASPMATVLMIAKLPLPLVEFFCLWQGFKAVQRKVDLPPKAEGAAALMIWYALICVLAVIQYDGFILGSAMVIGYFFILRSIRTLSKALDEAGYSIGTVPIKITDRCIALSISFVLLVGCIFGYLFGGSYPMEWSAVDVSEHAGVEDTKNHLRELGFPEYVLNDLTPEDIAACDNALRVVVEVMDSPVNDGRTETNVHTVNGKTWVEQRTVYDVKELRTTDVAVQMPDTQEKWIIFHHFLWTMNPGFYGTECIQLWPADQDPSGDWSSVGETTGRILYDVDGNTLSAPYHSLETITYTSSSIFFGEQTKTDVFATFSMPTKGENQRGYLTYAITAGGEAFISSWANYTHQRSPLQYPVVTAKEKRMADIRNEAWPFLTIQDAIQFSPAEAESEPVDSQG